MSAETVVSIPSAALLALAGLLAGWVDAIAGGGGLITVPSLLAAGVPPVFVLGTNKLQGTFGSGLAAWRYGRQPGLLDWRTTLAGALWTLTGAIAGTLVVTRLSSALLTRLIPVLLAAAALYVLISPRFRDDDHPARLPLPLTFALLGLTLGFYDGFFGPGTGSFWAVGLVSLGGCGLMRATGYTKAMNFTSNVAALAVFIVHGKVLFLPGLAMAVGQAAGAWLGAHMALRRGAGLIRPILGVMSLLVAAWLGWRLVTGR
jgi:uncharacterized membrane protein YfcA